MILLSLFWLLLGIVIGLIVLGARLQRLQGRNRLWLLAIAAASAFCGGWLGTLLLGRFFATAMALWIAVLCTVGVVVLPRSIGWIRARMTRVQRG